MFGLDYIDREALAGMDKDIVRNIHLELADNYKGIEEHCRSTGNQDLLNSVGGLLIRMSYIYWHGRIETPEELAEKLLMYRLSVSSPKAFSSIDDLI